MANEDAKDHDPAIVCGLLVAGIKQSITHHTNEAGGTCTIAAETFVKNVVTAFLFNIVVREQILSNSTLNNVIGTTYYQVDYARNQVQDLLENDSFVEALNSKI